MKYLLMIAVLASLALAGCQKTEEPAATPAPTPAATTTTGTPGKKSDTPVQSSAGSAVQPQ
jgi:nitrous oxide reductase accessory protein NosL